MTKQDLINEVATLHDFDKKDVAKVIDSAIHAIKKEVVSRKAVFIRGFGTFRPKTRAQKLARNVGTGVEVTIPERTVPTFKPSREFQNQVIESKTV